MTRIAVVLATVFVGCGGGGTSGMASDASSNPNDAAVDQGPCWPETTRVPQGTATIGTGRDAFQQMPDMLPLEYGMQDGFMFITNARMTGFVPGNPQNIFDPSNPRTRIRAFFADTDVPLNQYAKCPFRTPYAATASGDFEMVTFAAVVFETCWRSDRLIGQRFRIELEILDGAGGYATDTKFVTALPPTSGEYPVEQNTEPCPVAP